MTLIDTASAPQHTTVDAPRADSPLAHPAFGAAHRATVTPITMTLYGVSVQGEPIGFLEASDAGWIALSGMHDGDAVEIGRHHLFAGALRCLTNP